MYYDFDEKGMASRAYETAFKETGKQQGEYTVDDYYMLPEDMRFELIDGVLYYVSAPSTSHQGIVGEIFVELRNFIRGKKGKCVPFGSPVDVHLLKDNRTMIQPDVFVVCDRDKIIDIRIEGAPDFAVEVLSPSSRKKDTVIKVQKYKEAGVREFWLVDPMKEKVMVYDSAKGEAFSIYSFRDKVPVGIFDGELVIDMATVSEYIDF